MAGLPIFVPKILAYVIIDDKLMLTVRHVCVKKPLMNYCYYPGRYGEKVSFPPRKFRDANGENRAWLAAKNTRELPHTFHHRKLVQYET